MSNTNLNIYKYKAHIIWKMLCFLSFIFLILFIFWLLKSEVAVIPTILLAYLFPFLLISTNTLRLSIDNNSLDYITSGFRLGMHSHHQVHIKDMRVAVVGPRKIIFKNPYNSLQSNDSFKYFMQGIERVKTGEYFGTGMIILGNKQTLALENDLFLKRVMIRLVIIFHLLASKFKLFMEAKSINLFLKKFTIN